jgi:hypothetical protein
MRARVAMDRLDRFIDSSRQILACSRIVAGGDQLLDSLRFEIVDGVAMVTGVILDPCDLTPGYGFEKSA